MSQELQLGKYEFYPNDRLQQLIEELLFELRRFRGSGRSKPEYTEDELDRMYKEMAADEAANPDYFEWIKD
jgi:hypothetical protein